jgi:hypothetical protein
MCGVHACTPAPDEGEEHTYELTGEKAKKNGEKRCARARGCAVRAAPRLWRGHSTVNTQRSSGGTSHWDSGTWRAKRRRDCSSRRTPRELELHTRARREGSQSLPSLELLRALVVNDPPLVPFGAHMPSF